MNNNEFVDKMIFSYFENKEVPSSVQHAIENTELKKNNHTISVYLKRVAVVLVIPILFGTAYVLKNNGEFSHDIAIEEDNCNTEIEYEYSTIMADYAISTTPQGLYEYADLVVVGKWVKVNKCFAEEFGSIKTESEFEVLETIKGEYTSNKINVTYSGGTVSLEEYINSLSQSQIEKREYNKLSEDEIIGKTFEEAGVKVYPNTNYVIFLKYIEDKDYYLVLCDGYGMRELSEDGKIYNLDTKTFDTKLTDLK